MAGRSNAGNGEAAADAGHPLVALVCRDKDAVARFVAELTGRNDQILSLPCTWTLSTKYYTVELCLGAFIICLDGKGKWALPAQLSRAEAIILLLDYASYSSSDAKVLAELKDYVPDIEIALCAMLHPVLPPQQQQHKCWTDACIAEGYEMIEMDIAESADTTTSDQVDGLEEGSDVQSLKGLQDTYGVKRVQEALESHMWPGMVLKHVRSQLHDNTTDNNEEDNKASIGRDTMDATFAQFFASFGALDMDKDSEDVVKNSIDDTAQLLTMRDAAAGWTDAKRRAFAESFLSNCWQDSSEDEEDGYQDESAANGYKMMNKLDEEDDVACRR